jgi:hypothetical protein
MLTPKSGPGSVRIGKSHHPIRQGIQYSFLHLDGGGQKSPWHAHELELESGDFLSGIAFPLRKLQRSEALVNPLLRHWVPVNGAEEVIHCCIEGEKEPVRQRPIVGPRVA